MVNKMYQRGRSREYREMKKLRAEGYQIVARSAGSHSAVDIFGIKEYPGGHVHVKLLQCKPKSMSENARKKIEEENRWLCDDEVSMSFEVV